MEVTLDLVSDANSKTDSIIVSNKVPAIAGNEPDNIYCGNSLCGALIGRNVSVSTLLHKFSPPKNARVIVRCANCSRDNLIRGRNI